MGFTLVELMIVVAIIGILAAVAVPAFIKYIKKARTSEAPQQIEKLSAGARTYYLEEHQPGGSIAPVPPQFPETVARTPAVDCCLLTGSPRCAPVASDWDQATWSALKFSMDDPHYFRYEFESSGTSVDSEFTVRAHANLDCDSTLSTFSRAGEVQYLGNDMTLQGTTNRIRELE